MPKGRVRHLQTTKTEGVGDCWLLSIMAGFEVKDPKLVRKVDDAQRKTICTSRRHAIVEFAASSKKNGAFRFLCEMCALEVDFKDKNSVQTAEGAIAARLKDWKKPLHYGRDQEIMHPCAGWYFKRNILVMDPYFDPTIPLARILANAVVVVVLCSTML